MPEGSHTTLGGWEPKRCCYCGGKVVKTRQSCGFLFDDITGQTYAWHTTCKENRWLGRDADPDPGPAGNPAPKASNA